MPMRLPILIGILLPMLAACEPRAEEAPVIESGVVQSPEVWPAQWEEFRALLGQPIDAGIVQAFVGKYQLEQYSKGDSGGFSGYGKVPFSVLFRSNKVDRIVVTIDRAIDAEGRGPLFQGELPLNLKRDDSPEDAVRKLGEPTRRPERGHLSYHDRGLVISFGPRDQKLYEICVDAVP